MAQVKNPVLLTRMKKIRVDNKYIGIKKEKTPKITHTYTHLHTIIYVWIYIHISKMLYFFKRLLVIDFIN